MMPRRIFPRLMLSFIILSLFPLGGLALFYITEFEKTHLETMDENLSAIVDRKAGQISSYIDEKLSEVFVIAHTEQNIMTLKAMSEEFLKSHSIQTKDYKEKLFKYRPFYKTRSDSFGYYDVLLMDRNGNVVFSVIHEPDLGTNLFHQSEDSSDLAKAFRETIRLVDTQIVFSRSYQASMGRPAIFILNPIFENKNFIGVIAVQLDVDILTSVIADNTGLGISGETLLAQRGANEALYVGPNKTNKDSAYRFSVPFSRLSKPMLAAVTGESNKGISFDEDKEEILAVWRYIPHMRLGIVAKIDREEVYAPIFKMRQTVLIALIIVIIFATIIARYLAQSFVQPLQQFIRISQLIATGQLAERAPTQNIEEIQSLARSFNFMAGSIQEQQLMLESRVREKTKDLQLVSESYRKAKEAAEAANRAKGEFLANMSHEIRTPLNAVLGLTELVLQTQLDPIQSDYLRKVYSSSKALLGVLNDILDYSKIESGKMELESTRINIMKLVSESSELFSAQLSQKGLQCLIHIDPKVPKEILGDPLRISQILNNLIGNAIKFTEKGEIKINVSLLKDFAKVKNYSLGDHELYLQFEVSDTGIGLTPEKSKNLFQAFMQADNSITRKYGGTGLGLSICANLVEMMGGAIDVKSELNQGSNFTFYIKAMALSQGELKKSTLKSVQMEDFDESCSNQSPQEVIPIIPSFSGSRVLLVEDNPMNQLVASELLKKMGIKCQIVQNGAEAVEKVQNENFELILMDLHMPVMDGFEATLKIKALPDKSKIPIIALTAAAMSEDRERCAQIGIVDFIAKPMDLKTLSKVLSKWLKNVA